MEVGQQRLDHPKAKPRGDEETRVEDAGGDLPGLLREGLEGAHHGGPHGDDPPSLALGPRDGLGGRRGGTARVLAGCITCWDTSPSRTGMKVPGPTSSVTETRSTPRCSSASSTWGVKCRPAVGAATEPGSCA